MSKLYDGLTFKKNFENCRFIKLQRSTFGIFFCEIEKIGLWFKNNRNTTKITEVIINDDAIVYPFRNKFETNKYYIKSIELFPLLDIWYNYDICIQLIIFDPFLIEFVKHPNEELYFKAIKINPYVIKNIKNPTSRVCYEAIKKNGLVVQYLPPRMSFYIEAVKQNGHCLKYIDHKFVFNFCKQNFLSSNKKLTYHFYLYYLSVLDELYLNAVKQNGLALRYIFNPSYEICQKAIYNNSLAIRFVDKNKLEFYYGKGDHYYNLCLFAVSQNGLALEHIVDQTEELCWKAVQNNGLAIKFSKYITNDICTMAVMRNRKASLCLTPEKIVQLKQYCDSNDKNFDLCIQQIECLIGS